MGRKILVTGGVRSGKSAYALALAESFPGAKYFLATAQPLDGEMELRIQNHRRERPSHWNTVEEPVEIASVLERFNGGAFIIDCLTLWASNLLEAGEEEFRERVSSLTDSLARFRGDVVVVTNEVGMGIIPGNPLSRRYGDRLGLVNGNVARVCDQVVLMVAGLPVIIKRTAV